MELRQLRYFVHIVDFGSIARAARDLNVVPSALSQQISRLETELCTRLLQRSISGARATDAGMAFYRQAQLTLRHANAAVEATQQARLSGHVKLGMTSSASTVLAIPYLNAMQNRYPDVRMTLVESLSTNLNAMLEARRLDFSILFGKENTGQGNAMPLVDEKLFLIGCSSMPQLQLLQGSTIQIKQLTDVPLVLGSHDVRGTIDSMFDAAGCKPKIALEINGLSILLDAVLAGLGGTILPGSSTLRLPREAITCIEISDCQAFRRSLLVSLNEEELSPAALAARIVLRDVVKELVQEKKWPGAILHKQ